MCDVSGLMKLFENQIPGAVNFQGTNQAHKLLMESRLNTRDRLSEILNQEFIWSWGSISDYRLTWIVTSSAKLTNEQSLHLELINGLTGVSPCGCTRVEYSDAEQLGGVRTKISLNEEKKCQLGREGNLRNILDIHLIWCIGITEEIWSHLQAV